jgi:hypothetical protein
MCKLVVGIMSTLLVYLVTILVAKKIIDADIGLLKLKLVEY